MESNQATELDEATELNEVIMLALEATARKYGGFAHPAVIQKGTDLMIDGYHRTAVVKKLAAEGLEIVLDVREIETDDPKGMAMDINSTRRIWNDAEERRTQVQFLALQTDKEGNSFSVRQMADAVGASHETIRRDLAKAPDGTDAPPPTVTFVTPGASTTVLSETAGTKPSRTKGKDGKARAAKASKEVIINAWAMKDSGMSTSAIAKDLNRGESSVRHWFSKERPEAVAPKISTTINEECTKEKFLLPKTSRCIMEREKKEIKRRTELLISLIELNRAMRGMWKYAQSKFKTDGRSVLRAYMKRADEEMVEAGIFSSACVALGLAPDATYKQMLKAIDKEAKDLSLSARTALYQYGFELLIID